MNRVSCEGPRRPSPETRSQQPGSAQGMRMTVQNPTNRRELHSYRRAMTELRTMTRLLQQMIQPAQGTAIDVSGLRVDVRCVGLDQSLRIGGDWYLSMPLVGGDL